MSQHKLPARNWLLRLPLLALGALGLLLTAACNSDDTSDAIIPSEYDLTGVAIKSFSLKANTKVLHNLDSVYFSIDLTAARIFNADSLPAGTNVSALEVEMSTDQVKAIEVHSYTAAGADTVIDFVANTTAKLNFAHGPVTMKLTSLDATVTRTYSIFVNVHRMVPDSLAFTLADSKSYPSALQPAQIVAQKTVKQDETFYSLSADRSGAYSMARTADIHAWQWEAQPVSMPQPVDVRSLTATSQGLFILAEDGTLLTSTDGIAWQATAERWKAIIAPYDNRLLGLKASAEAPSGYLFAEYPATTEAAPVPSSFPISGASQAVAFSTKWAELPQLLIAGGRTLQGELTGATWAFDGTQWARIGGGLPPAEGYALARYTVARTDSVSWRVSTSQVLLAYGGRNEEGTTQRVMYLSRDMGMNWQKASKNLQPPHYLPALAFADMLTDEATLFAHPAAAAARAVAPITEWQCPYLYIFGGLQTDDVFNPLVWKGAVNYLTFKPLQ